MSSRVLMIVSALFLAACGLATLFAPQEVLGVHGTAPDTATVLLVQMMGALYLGFALLNWAARGIIIGGIYARPVAAANLFHFLIVTLLLAKAAVTHRVLPLAISAVVFGVFAVGFGLLLFRGPPGVALGGSDPTS